MDSLPTPPGGDAAEGTAPVILDPPPPSRKRRWLVAVAVLVITALIGFPLGWIWWLVGRIPGRVEPGGVYYTSVEPEHPAAAEGWFILLSFGTGILFALIAWIFLRRYRGPLTLGALAIGSIVTGWLAWRFGHTIDRGAIRAQATTAKDGTILHIPPDLRIRTTGPTSKSDWGIALWHGIPYIGGVLLFVAVAAIALYLILAAFARSPSLGLQRRAEAAAEAALEAAEAAAAAEGRQ